MDFIETTDQEMNFKVLEFISRELLPYTCQLFTLNDNGTPTPFGSGVYTKLGESYFILTASHVAEYIRENSGKGKHLYVRSKVKDGYLNVVGSIRGSNLDIDTVDLAYIKVNESFLSQLNNNYRFLPISKFRARPKLYNVSNCCVVGYPEVNSWAEGRSLITGANSYLLEPCRKNVYDYYNFKPEENILLEVKGKGKSLSDGSVEKVSEKEFHGISGGGLWLLIFKGGANNIPLEIDFRLIGIMTEYRKGKYYCLVANHVDLLFSAITKYGGINFEIKLLPDSDPFAGHSFRA